MNRYGKNNRLLTICATICALVIWIHNFRVIGKSLTTNGTASAGLGMTSGPADIKIDMAGLRMEAIDTAANPFEAVSWTEDWVDSSELGHAAADVEPDTMRTTEIELIGLMTDSVLMIEHGGLPFTLSGRDTVNGLFLQAISGDSVSLVANGTKRVLRIGEQVSVVLGK